MYVAISQPPWMRQGFGSTDCSVIVEIDKSSVTNTCQLPISVSRICHRRERLSLLGLRTRRGETAISHCLLVVNWMCRFTVELPQLFAAANPPVRLRGISCKPTGHVSLYLLERCKPHNRCRRSNGAESTVQPPPHALPHCVNSSAMHL